MIAIDTNILARFYCEDPDDPEAKRQRPAARRVVVDSPALFVPLTVVLELEWVMRGFYEVGREGFCAVVDHLLGMGHVTVERWEAVKDAVELHRTGVDFADALHLSTSRGCESLISFDRSFIRAVARSGAKPAVSLPRSKGGRPGGPSLNGNPGRPPAHKPGVGLSGPSMRWLSRSFRT